ncbi:MAG: MBL fold metallo-hydrolase [Planctomycetes bacterium]|nr:MBL fold metallo-hydrolase [Planctomycetota bacterium]
MSKTTTTFAVIITAISTCFIAQPASAQGRFDEVEIKTTKLTDSVYMLVGAGGNIGLSVGEDGAFMIDDQFAELSEKILAAVAEITDKPIKFLVNTHHHGDHTGGNKNIGKTGTIIVAHENVRKRLTKDQFIKVFNSTTPASSGAALPVVTFTKDITLHINSDKVHIFHVDPAHTDGDSLVHFKKANVLHMGDIFFNGMYPFIDVSSGGSIDGMIKAAERGIKLSDDKTKIIPGHGPLATKQNLDGYHKMLIAARDLIKPLVEQGKSRDEVIAAKPTATLDEVWGKGFMKPDVWVGIVYDGMVKEE